MCVVDGMNILTPTAISKLSDDDLVERLRQCCFQAKRLLAQIILLLIEVEHRRLHLKSASPSPFEFCVKRLGMSEGEAYRRTKAASLVARFPRLLPYIERGDIHLTAVVQLRDYFTEENLDELVLMARRKSKMEVSELVARLAPRPDVPARLRKLPEHDARSRLGKAPKPAIDPLSEGRYRLQVTGSRAFRDKLLRARDLMMHANPTGDLAVVVERAVDELLEVLEKRIFGKASRKDTQTHAPVAEDDIVPVSPAADARDFEKGKKNTARSPRHPGLARTKSSEAAARTGATVIREAAHIVPRRSLDRLAPAQVARGSHPRAADERRASKPA